MSKSLKRVRAAMASAGVDVDILEMPSETRTTRMAAAAAGCEIDQIAKSIIFLGTQSGQAIMFVTAGSNRVDMICASNLADEPLAKANADLIRSQTGFAIGGVSPLGRINPNKSYFDPRRWILG